MRAAAHNLPATHPCCPGCLQGAEGHVPNSTFVLAASCCMAQERTESKELPQFPSQVLSFRPARIVFYSW